MFKDCGLFLVSAVTGFGASLALAGLEARTAQIQPGESVARIHMADLAFSPGTITVARGTPVDFFNDDFVDHTATGETGKWDVIIPAGSVARTSFETLGTFAYFCRYHPGMKGTVRVTGD